MTKDRAASLLFLCSGLYGFYFSIQLPMGRWNEPGPGVFPFILSFFLLISGAAWFIRGKHKAAEKGQGEKAGGLAFIKSLSTPVKIVALTALLILFLIGPVISSHHRCISLFSFCGYPAIGSLFPPRLPSPSAWEAGISLQRFLPFSCRRDSSLSKGFPSSSGGGFPWMS